MQHPKFTIKFFGVQNHGRPHQLDITGEKGQLDFRNQRWLAHLPRSASFFNSEWQFYNCPRSFSVMEKKGSGLKFQIICCISSSEGLFLKSSYFDPSNIKNYISKVRNVLTFFFVLLSDKLVFLIIFKMYLMSNLISFINLQEKTVLLRNFIYLLKKQ